MKIICIGRNYSDHSKELNNPIPDSPVIFCKPDSSLLHSGKAFFIPEFSNNIHFEIELVVKICRLGKHINPEFSHRYYNQVTVGIDFTARDVQNELKKAGLPWEKAKGFDGSAVIGKFIGKEEASLKMDDIDFSLKRNGQLAQKGNSKDMLFSVDHLIAYISSFMTLKIGDLIYTGTPAGVAKVDKGDDLRGFIGDKELLKVVVK